MKKRRVVIIGGGFGGAFTAKYLTVNLFPGGAVLLRPAACACYMARTLWKFLNQIYPLSVNSGL